MATVLGRELQPGHILMLYLENEDGDYVWAEYHLIELCRQTDRYNLWRVAEVDIALSVRNDQVYCVA